MKILNIASTFTHINDLYIAEAENMPYASAAIPPKKRSNAFVRFLNSGVGVAVICGIVAVGVTLGVLMMGWNADPVSPVGTPTPPMTFDTNEIPKSFAFAYKLDPEKDVYEPGDTLTVTTGVKNLGEAFTVKGSSQAFHATAWLIPHGSSDIHQADGKIIGNFAVYDDYMIQKIQTGQIGTHRGSFLIPESASGMYDLVLSYKEEYRIFENAIQIGYGNESSSLSFVCTDIPKEDRYAPGDSFVLNLTVKGYAPSIPAYDKEKPLALPPEPLYAKLLLHGANSTDGVTATEGVLYHAEADPLDPCLTSLYFTLPFTLPQEASRGWYDLHLSYMGVDTLLPNQIHITEAAFRFTYEMRPHGSDPYTTYSCTPGEIFPITATVQNLGEAFEITGHSLEFSPHISLKHKYHNTELTVNCAYPDDIVTRIVEAGEIGRIQGYVTVPEDSTHGWYDLYLSYGGTVKKIDDALYVLPPQASSVAPVSREEAKAIADAYMLERNLPLPLDRLHFSISESSSNQNYTVFYTYRLGGFPTAYQFNMKIDYSGTLFDYEHCVWNSEAYYAMYTDEDVSAARQRLVTKMSAELGSRFTGSQWAGRLTETDGNLYIRAEAILPCEHGEACEGLLGSSSCSGHEHRFFEEEVTHITA